MGNMIKIRLGGHAKSCNVYINREWLDPRASQKIRDYSTNWFSWGYGGSGPIQLAFAICLVLYPEPIARRHYQQFQRDYIAGLPPEDFDIDFMVDDTENLMEKYEFNLEDNDNGS